MLTVLFLLTLIAISDAVQTCSSVIRRDSSDGIYHLASDQGQVNVYCDMHTDGGGWTLLYNYEHEGGTNPVLLAHVAPLSLSSNSHTTVSNLGYAHELIREVRFECTSGSHSRRLHFKTAEAHIIHTAYSGKKNNDPSYWKDGFIPLNGHTAYLPEFTNQAYDNGAFLEFPFREINKHNWAIRGSGFRWECDDNSVSNNFNTTHRVWVRLGCPPGTYKTTTGCFECPTDFTSGYDSAVCSPVPTSVPTYTPTRYPTEYPTTTPTVGCSHAYDILHPNGGDEYVINETVPLQSNWTYKGNCVSHFLKFSLCFHSPIGSIECFASNATNSASYFNTGPLILNSEGRADIYFKTGLPPGNGYYTLKIYDNVFAASMAESLPFKLTFAFDDDSSVRSSDASFNLISYRKYMDIAVIVLLSSIGLVFGVYACLKYFVFKQIREKEGDQNG